MSRILIMDEVETRPGQAQKFQDAYLERYVPGATKRGMKLEASWRTPVAEIAERPATLYFIWSVADVDAWWGMRVGTDSEKNAWWHSVDDLIASRRRRFLTDIGEEVIA